jgi:hypothetical protein
MEELPIKKHCVSCGKKLPGTRYHYLNYGNYCQPCSRKADLKAKKSSQEEPKEDLFKKYGWRHQEEMNLPNFRYRRQRLLELEEII